MPQLPPKAVVLITGSTDGLGRAVARRIAAGGAHVIVHGRSRARGDALANEINASGTGSARFYAADFASLDAVRAFGSAILADYPRVDVLINNAGILTTFREISRDGHELQFAVNYLASFLLTRILLPRLVASAPSRIINVSSLAQEAIDFSDVMLTKRGRRADGYAQSKLAQVLFTVDLAEELKDSDVTITALHPATRMPTTMVRNAGFAVMSSIDEGVDAVMHQIEGGGIASGQYFNGRRPARADAQAYDASARAQLRALSEKLTSP
jgi:NAD(P)-dependent dehydrogenase (short-subunit alcohol dehydrogenase family)